MLFRVGFKHLHYTFLISPMLGPFSNKHPTTSHALVCLKNKGLAYSINFIRCSAVIEGYRAGFLIVFIAYIDLNRLKAADEHVRKDFGKQRFVFPFQSEVIK